MAVLEPSFFFPLSFKMCLFVYKFGYAWAFSSYGKQALLFRVMCGLLVAAASLVAEHRL